MSNDIPDRCRLCAHWMGRYSGDSDDKRCNRNWGHEKAHGDFWTPEIQSQDPESEPAYVKRDCKVRRWGPPISSASDPDPSPEYVDAFVRTRPKTITLRIDGIDYSLTADQLRKYLMADEDQKQELLEAFETRTQKRQSVHDTIRRHYEDKYGTSPDVYEGANELPPYRRGKEKIPSGILQLDEALNGGWIPGGRVNIAGSPDSGKSTLYDVMAGSHLIHYRNKVYDFAKDADIPEKDARQRAREEKVGLIRPEDYNTEYVKHCMNLNRDKIGDDPEEIFFNQGVNFIATDLAEESFETIVEAMNVDSDDLSDKHGPTVPSWMLPVTYRMIGIDSIDAERYAEEIMGSDGEPERMGDNHRISPQARLLAEVFRKSYQAAKIPMTLVLISQDRVANIGGWGGGSKDFHRGNAHPYFTNLEMYLYSTTSDSHPFLEVHINFKKVHRDASVSEGDETVVYLVPENVAEDLGVEPGMNPRVNAIKHVLDNVNQHPDAQNGTETLWRNASWVYYQPEDQEEPIKTQGSDPANVINWLDEEGYLKGLHERLLNDLMNESEEPTNGNNPEANEG